ncbi:MAG: hypothetical protein HW412_1186 [Bacteroidetes bacterium]|nr:hypothetical protein [Bacteroidota bacterium]
MKLFTTYLALCLTCMCVYGNLVAQESDYDVKVNFEAEFKTLKEAMDGAKSTAALDSLKPRIDALELQYSPRQKFLDKALYPETFAEKIANLRNLFQLTYDRIYLIQDQGIKIEELEGRIILLSARIDSLTSERNRLFAELQESKASVSRMRETIRKLTATLQAKDRLIFALIDSIFLPYDKNLNQIADVQKEAISAKLLKANVAARVYDIAADNLKFLEMTQLQPKDYANLIEQNEQFTAKWNGLREKINAVSYATEAEKATGKGKRKGTTSGGTAQASPIPQTHVDSVLMDWNTRLASIFWGSLYKEFTSKGVRVLPFTDGRSFSTSIRAYVDSTKAKDEDAKVFVEELWKARIDKEWRDALSRESMLGKSEYAALDKYVSTLSEEKLDAKFFLYIGVVIVLIILAWWTFGRKAKPQAPAGQS